MFLYKHLFGGFRNRISRSYDNCLTFLGTVRLFCKSLYYYKAGYFQKMEIDIYYDTVNGIIL